MLTIRLIYCTLIQNIWTKSLLTSYSGEHRGVYEHRAGEIYTTGFCLTTKSLPLKTVLIDQETEIHLPVTLSQVIYINRPLRGDRSCV